MVFLIAGGITMLIIDLLIEEFNEGSHNNFSSWLAGVWWTFGVYQFFERCYLAFVLCCLPSLTILIVKLVRRSSHAERV